MLSAVLLGAWMTLLQFPALLFHHAVSAHGLTLRSDRPFDEATAKRVLAQVRQRLDAAPFGKPGFSADICIANSPWRRWIYFTRHPKALGISLPFTRHVFLREARVDLDRMTHPTGGIIQSYFTLSHVIGHELGHVQMYRHFGRLRTLVGTSQWIREGYAEYVGGIFAFDFEADRRAFLAQDASMEPALPGIPPYRRLHLLMTFLMEKQGWTMERILKEKPSQETVEGWLRSGS
jgi:hypothetical protein